MLQEQINKKLESFGERFGHDDYCRNRNLGQVNEDNCQCEQYEMRKFISSSLKEMYSLGKDSANASLMPEIEKMKKHKHSARAFEGTCGCGDNRSVFDWDRGYNSALDDVLTALSEPKANDAPIQSILNQKGN